MLYQKFFNKLLFLSWFHTIDWNGLNVLQSLTNIHFCLWICYIKGIACNNVNKYSFSVLFWSTSLVDFHSIFNDQLLFFSLILKRWKTNVKECRNFGAYLSLGEGPDIRKCWFLNLVNWPSDNICITIGERTKHLTPLPPLSSSMLYPS